MRHPWFEVAPVELRQSEGASGAASSRDESGAVFEQPILEEEAAQPLPSRPARRLPSEPTAQERAVEGLVENKIDF